MLEIVRDLALKGSMMKPKAHPRTRACPAPPAGTITEIIFRLKLPRDFYAFKHGAWGVAEKYQTEEYNRLSKLLQAELDEIVNKACYSELRPKDSMQKGEKG